jgi:hypothetical protein
MVDHRQQQQQRTKAMFWENSDCFFSGSFTYRERALIDNAQGAKVSKFYQTAAVAAAAAAAAIE